MPIARATISARIGVRGSRPARLDVDLTLICCAVPITPSAVVSPRHMHRMLRHERQCKEKG